MVPEQAEVTTMATEVTVVAMVVTAVVRLAQGKPSTPLFNGNIYSFIPPGVTPTRVRSSVVLSAA